MENQPSPTLSVIGDRSALSGIGISRRLQSKYRRLFQPSPRLRIEQMNGPRIGHEVDGLPWQDADTLARHRDHFLRADMREHLGFGTSRLDHRDHGGDAAGIADAQMLGA